MAELRPLLEAAFAILDHLCSGQFKLGPEVMYECIAFRHVLYDACPPTHVHPSNPIPFQHTGQGGVVGCAEGDRGTGGAAAGIDAEGGGGAPAPGAGARGVSVIVDWALLASGGGLVGEDGHRGCHECCSLSHHPPHAYTHKCASKTNRSERMTPEQRRKKEQKQERKEKKAAALGLMARRR